MDAKAEAPPVAETVSAELADRPTLAVLVFALLQMLVWTLAPTLTHTAPPLDVTESYLWGQEWVIGTFKHPNMPGWILETSRELTGAIGWPAYLASQLFVAATYLIVFLLGREMMDTRRALAGTLLLAGVFYFSWPTIEFNHNVAQMPFWAGIAWILWRLRSRGDVAWWALLGFLAADSLYAKLSSGLLLFVAGLWLLYDRPLRSQLATRGPWIGLGVFLILSAPLLTWLVREHFVPLTYAAERMSKSGEGPMQFLGAQVLACAGLLVLAAITGLLRDPRSSTEHFTTDPVTPHVPGQAVWFLLTMTLAPILLTTAAALLTGAGLKSMWGAPMLGLSGLLVVALNTGRVTRAAVQRLLVAVACLLVVLPIGYGIDTLVEARITGKPKRQNWPQAAIARRFDGIWQSKTGKTLSIVAGERWIAGLVALRSGRMPSILTDGDLTLSPWITPERLKQQGALLVWEMKGPDGAPPDTLLPLLGGLSRGVERFDWPLFPGAPPLLIGYAILTPA